MSSNTKRKRTIILIITVMALVFATGAYIVVPRGVTHMDLVTAEGETIGETLEVYVGTDTSLSCKITPASFIDRKVGYAIADNEIASIDEEGLLTALKEGETRLTVECAGTRKNYIVRTKTAVEDITGLDKEIVLYEGEEFQLEPKIKLVEKDLEKPEILYKTKRNTIATVDKNGLITAVKEGETTITVSAGDVSKKVKVIVETEPVETYVPVTRVNNDTVGNSNNKATKKAAKKGGKNNGGNGGNSSASDTSDGDGSGSSGGGSDGGGSGGDSGSGGGSDSGSSGGSGGGSSGGGSDGGSSDSGE